MVVSLNSRLESNKEEEEVPWHHCTWWCSTRRPCHPSPRSGMDFICKHIIYKLGCNQNYYTFALISLMKIVMCSKFPWNKFINYKCFDMRLGVAWHCAWIVYGNTFNVNHLFAIAGVFLLPWKIRTSQRRDRVPACGRDRPAEEVFRGEVLLCSSMNTFKRRWTLTLYWRPCSERNNGVRRSTRRELGSYLRLIDGCITQL